MISFFLSLINFLINSDWPERHPRSAVHDTQHEPSQSPTFNPEWDSGKKSGSVSFVILFS